MDQEQQEYNEFIKESVKDGSYFKDAFDWYMFRYVGPVCERTLLFFIASFAAVISYVLVVIVNNSLPLTEQIPVIMRAKDTSIYFPVIQPLKVSKEETKTVDEAIARYLLINYLEEREGFDFRRADIEVLNKKFSSIRNNSSLEEYRNFQAFMSKDNADSPIRNWRKNVTREVEVISVDFKRIETKNFVDKARRFLSSEIPSEADIRYRVIKIENGVTDKSEKFLTRIGFKFSGVDPKNPNKKLDFTVVDYKTFKIK